MKHFTPLHELPPLPNWQEHLSNISARVDLLRAQNRARIADAVDSAEIFELPVEGRERKTGVIFAEDVGAPITLLDGQYQYIYLEGDARSRAASLQPAHSSRRTIFSSLAGQFPKSSRGKRPRILNIGAGLDTTLVDEFRAARHDLICTDYAESVTRALRAQVFGLPTFACDLRDLDHVLDPDSVDGIVGNSVLGYVELCKLNQIVANLVQVMRQGGIFTFDLMPNPNHSKVAFDLIDEALATFVGPTPVDLLRLIKRFGPEQAPTLMRILGDVKPRSMQVLMVKVLKEAFEQHGLRCSTGKYGLTVGSLETPMFILRVSKRNDALLRPIPREEPFILEGPELWSDSRKDFDKMPFGMVCMDREWAAQINAAMGLNLGVWDLMHHLQQAAHATPADPKNVEALLDQYHPDRLKAKLQPYLDGAQIPASKNPIPQWRNSEQDLRDMYWQGDAQFKHVSPRKMEQVIREVCVP